jgi:hypothetical protein
MVMMPRAQQIVHHREERFFDLPGIGGVAMIAMRCSKLRRSPWRSASPSMDSTLKDGAQMTVTLARAAKFFAAVGVM